MASRLSSDVLSEGHPARRALVPLAVVVTAGAQLVRLLAAQDSGAVVLPTSTFVIVALSVCLVWPVGQWFVLRRLLGDDPWSQAWATLAVLAVGWYPWLTLTTLPPRDVVAVSFLPVAVGLFLDGRTRRGARRVVELVAGPALAVAVAVVLSGVASRAPGPATPETPAQAAGEVLLGTALRLPPAWLGGALVVCGVVWLVLGRRWLVLPAVHVVLGVLYVLASSPWIPYLGYAAWTSLPPATVFVACLGVSGSLLAGAGAASLLALARGMRLGRWPMVLLAVVALGMAVMSDTGLVAGLVSGVVAVTT